MPPSTETDLNVFFTDILNRNILPILHTLYILSRKDPFLHIIIIYMYTHKPWYDSDDHLMMKQLKSMNPGMRLIVSSLWRKHLIWERKGTNYLCCPGPQKCSEKLNTEVVPGGDAVLQQATSEFPSWHPLRSKASTLCDPLSLLLAP